MSQFRIILNFGEPSVPSPTPSLVALQSAVLCVDCEMLSNATGSACPACGGAALMSVAEALGGVLAGRQTAKLLESYDHDSSGIVRKLVDSVPQ